VSNLSGLHRGAGSSSDDRRRRALLNQLRLIRDHLRSVSHPRPSSAAPDSSAGGISNIPWQLLGTAVPVQPRLRRSTRRRLSREHDRLIVRLQYVAIRDLSRHQRRRLQTQFTNRLVRIRRRLGLSVTGPRKRPSYRVSEAAACLGISPRQLLRWEAVGLISSIRSRGAHRYFARKDLLLLRARMPA
jgi:MerR-like DNA binding protein